MCPGRWFSEGLEELDVLTVGEPLNPRVERHQPDLVAASHGEQVGISDLAVADQSWEVGIGERDVVAQEDVALD